MKSRILVAVAGLPLLVWIVLWARIGWMMGALGLLSGIGAWELQKCVSRGNPGPMGICAGVWAALMTAESALDPRSAYSLAAGMVTALFAWAVLKGGAVPPDRIFAGIFSGVCVACSFGSFLRVSLAGLPRGYLLLPFVLSFACDTCAFFAGRSLGRHKLAPKVSPHKTVEGAVGGLLGAAAAGILFAVIINRAAGESLSYLGMGGLSLLCGATAQIGDLSFSLIKRQYGVKDYGRLFLEHGGVLDRFDSVLFVAPVVEQFLLSMTAR